MDPKVFAIVLNWNKPDDTIECLESCQKIEYSNFEILLVDNHSSDDSVARIKQRFPDLNILVNPSNLGYAGGNNAGIKYALQHGADFVLILNNDTEVTPQMLSLLVQAAQKNPQSGILAPKVLYYDDRTIINSMGTSMDWFRMRPRLGECNSTDRQDFSEFIPKDILLGCSLLVPRPLIEKIGMFDENFFILHEEADWCLRSLRAGYKNLTVSKAVIYHKSSKTMRNFTLLTHYYSTRNFLYLIKKNAGPLDWAKSRAGLCYHLLKNLAGLLVSSGQTRKLAKVFFIALADYSAGKMGKCQRVFE